MNEIFLLFVGFVITGVFFKFDVEIDVGEESIVSSPSDQLFKSNLTFFVICVFNLQFEKSMFLRRVVHSQSTLQRQLRCQII
jgi:hypothetical protein